MSFSLFSVICFLFKLDALFHRNEELRCVERKCFSVILSVALNLPADVELLM